MPSLPPYSHKTLKRTRSPSSAFLYDHKRAKTGDINQRATQCRSEIGLVALESDVYVVPQDLGSRIYKWYLQNAKDTPESQDSETESEDLEIGDLPFTEETQRPTQLGRDAKEPVAMEPWHGSGFDPSLELNEEPNNQRTWYPSSSNSDLDPVFSPTTQDKCYSDTSSSDHKVRRNPSIASEKGPTIATLDRPRSYPHSWDQAHPADKMLICQRRQGQSWRSIALRWKAMTGSEDDASYLKCRCRQVKKRLGICTDVDIDRVLAHEGATKPQVGDSSLRAEEAAEKNPMRQMPLSDTWYSETLETAEVPIEMVFEPVRPAVNHPNSSTQWSAMRPRKLPDDHDSFLASRRSYSTNSSSQPDDGASMWIRLSLPSKREGLRSLTRPKEPAKHTVGKMDTLSLQRSSYSALEPYDSAVEGELGFEIPLESLSHKKSAIIQKPLVSSTLPLPEDQRFDVAFKEQERRRKLSIAMRAAWAKRKMNGDEAQQWIQSINAVQAKRRAQDEEGLGSPQASATCNVAKHEHMTEMQADQQVEAKQRQSESMKATWAKRIAEGHNGRFGGLPKVSTIKTAEKKARRSAPFV